MMTKVLHVNQQHKLHGVDDDKGTSCKSTTQVAQRLHGVDDDKGTSCKSTAQVAWCNQHGVDDDTKSTTQVAWCR